MRRIGYIRVSTREQNPDRQITAMAEFGLSPSEMVIEKQSGKNFDRPLYHAATKRLREGDMLVVKSIDRLGRNYAEIIEEWRRIVKEKGADIVVLDMPLLDTRRDRDLTGTLIADIVLQLLSYVAETEREFIRTRQREGIDAARQRGVKFGRRSLRKPGIWTEVYADWLSGKITTRQAADILDEARSTFYRWIAEERSET